MTYQALYRTWRPQRFGDIAGQRPITRTLANAVVSGRTAHAYLFCGPRGTGKTTTAKVLAKAVNCPRRDGAEPCNECANCTAINSGLSVDVLEIDAASNRGIDEIRELREQVKFRPASSKYRVYIVDEVHMLTGEAFNALLKTLEEPPGHVIFILATTAAYKVPLTIISRCQRFDFRRISRADILKRLDHIIKAIGLEVEDGVPELIARVSQGSLRDALGVLDQVAALGGDRVTLRDLHDILGTVGREVLDELTRHLTDGDVGGALALLAEVGNTKDVRLFAREFNDHLRGLLLKAVEAPSKAETRASQRLLRLLTLCAEAEREMRHASRPGLPLELAMVRFVHGGEEDDPTARIAALEERVHRLERRLAHGAGAPPGPREKVRLSVKLPAPPPPRDEPAPEPPAPPQPKPAPEPPPPPPTKQTPAPNDIIEEGAGTVAADIDAVRRRWTEILSECGMVHYASRVQPVRVEDKTLTITGVAFLMNLFQQPDYTAALEGALSRVLAVTWRVNCVTGEPSGEA